ncbi:MAG: M20/M25/M40 family metallo-hydrolase, partial [Mycobacteriales bacterium]
MSPPDRETPLAALAEQLVDLPSESGQEGPIADLVEGLLRGGRHLLVERAGNAVLARTDLGRGQRVLVAGHLDTVPAAGNLPARREGRRLVGCGASDMKAALAVMVTVALEARAPARDLTIVCYDQEEVAASRNGLGRLVRTHPDWLGADLALLMEPTGGLVEAGCQGTLRVRVTVPGSRAHTARAWLG